MYSRHSGLTITALTLLLLAACNHRGSNVRDMLVIAQNPNHVSKKTDPLTATPTPGGPTATPTPASAEWECDVINRQSDGLDNADARRRVALSELDKEKETELSNNKSNSVSLFSNAGKVQIRVVAKKDNYTRGQVEAPLVTSALSLIPDNQTDSLGYVSAECMLKKAQATPTGTPTPGLTRAAVATPTPAPTGGAPTPTPVPAQKAKWKCTAENYLDDDGSEFKVSKSIEVSSDGAEQTVLLFDVKTKGSVEIRAKAGRISIVNIKYVGTGDAKQSVYSIGETDALKDKTLTLFQPGRGLREKVKVSCVKE